MSPRICVRVITIAAMAFALLQPAFTQIKGSGSTGTGTTTGTTTSSGTTGTLPPPSTGNPNSTANTTANPSAGSVAPPAIMVSGRVMLEDGTAPSDSVVIERVCNGNPRAEGYTDTRGYFVLQLGSGNSQFQDASETAVGLSHTSQQLGGIGGLGGGLGSSTGPVSSIHSVGLDTRLMNCELRARLSGYRSQTVSLMEHRALDNPDVGIILLHRLAPTEGAATVSAAALAVPKPADKAYNKGLSFLKKGKPEEARASFQSAIDLYPQFSSAWFELGKLQAIDGQPEDAHKSFLAATQADPQSVGPYLELALLSLHAKNWHELADVTYRALKLNSFDYPQAYFLNAVANYNLKKLDTAEKSARAAQRLDTRHIYPEISRLLGIILVNRQQYAEAADALRDFLLADPHSVEAPAVRQQLDDLEKKTIPADQMAKK